MEHTVAGDLLCAVRACGEGSCMYSEPEDYRVSAVQRAAAGMLVQIRYVVCSLVQH